MKPSSDTEEISILKFEAGTKYAIVSHVWADGYDSPNENKIHKCVPDSLNQLYNPGVGESVCRHGPASSDHLGKLSITSSLYIAIRASKMRQLFAIVGGDNKDA